MHALAAVDSHPHLVRYHTAWIEKDAAADGEHLYIQLEACDTSLGNLRVLKSQAREAELVEIMRQVNQSMICWIKYVFVWLPASFSGIVSPNTKLLFLGSTCSLCCR